MIATISGDIDIVEVIVAASNTLDSKDNNGNTALGLAAIQDQLEIATFLLESGANPNVVQSSWYDAPYAGREEWSAYTGGIDVAVQARCIFERLYRPRSTWLGVKAAIRRSFGSWRERVFSIKARFPFGRRESKLLLIQFVF